MFQNGNQEMFNFLAAGIHTAVTDPHDPTIIVPMLQPQQAQMENQNVIMHTHRPKHHHPDSFT